MAVKPIERHPVSPLPPGYRPLTAKPYNVRTGDTWESVALQNNLDVQKLIHFNFQTNNPDEVNWYLHHRVGCVKPSPSGMNWAFSSDARPGVIYLPIAQSELKPVKKTKAKTITSPFALEFDGPSSPLDTVGKLFDGFQMLDIGLAIFGVEFAGAALLVVGSATAPFAPFVLMGGMHEAAINELRKKQMKRGMAMGIVLAADGRSMNWIKSHNGYEAYYKTQPVRDINYQQYGKQLQGIYNTSFMAGLGHGSQFTEDATKQLFKYCLAQMNSYGRSHFTGDPKGWNDKTWEYYYTLCAAALEQKIKLN